MSGIRSSSSLPTTSHLTNLPSSGGALTPVAVTEDFNITSSDDGKLFHNTGAGEDITGTLASGLPAGFRVGVANKVGGIPTGGTVTTDGDYTIHTFTTSGTLIVPSDITAEVLVVGGGGASAKSGGGDGGGSGGAGGGVQRDASFNITPNTYPVTIGNGGATRADRGTGASGGNSSLGSLLVAGGGIGGGVFTEPGGSSGSPQSNSGGANSGDWGGGGGGAGGVGLTGNSYTDNRAGGPGISYNISGASIEYGKGGGQSVPTAVQHGVDGTGGGGGCMYGGSAAQATGGKGIVIIKYLTPAAASAITLTPASGKQLPGTISANSELKSSAKDNVIIMQAVAEDSFISLNGVVATNGWVDQL